MIELSKTAQHDFEVKIIDDKFCLYLCPQDWIVNEKGSIFHRVYYVYGGHAVYEGNNQRLELKKGYIYIFPANRPYNINHNPNMPFKCLWFHITISPVILNQIICFDVDGNLLASNLLKTIECAVESQSTPAEEKILIEELLHSLLYLINCKEPFITLNNENLNTILEYIHTHFIENITNQTLSTLCGYDKSYFIRLFQKVLGVSPQNYILNYRMSKAVGLIRENMQLTEVALNVGYTDVKAFSRAFRRVKGVPPSEYRKSHYLQP